MADLRPRLAWRPDITPPPCRMSRGLERNLSRHFFFFWLVLFFSFARIINFHFGRPLLIKWSFSVRPFFFSVPPPYANTEGVLKARFQGGRVLASTRRCPPPWHVRPQSPLTHAVYLHELKRPLCPRACVTHASFFSIKRRPGNVLRDDGITRTRSVHFVWSHGARTDIEACATVVFFLDVRRRYGESR